MSDDDLTIDDVADFMDSTESDLEDLQETINDMQDKVPESEPVTHDEADDLFGEVPDTEDVDARARGVVEHLVKEDCDDDWCNDIRGALGVDHDHDHSGDETGESADESEATPEDDGDDGAEEEADDGPKNVAFEDSL